MSNWVTILMLRIYYKYIISNIGVNMLKTSKLAYQVKYSCVRLYCVIHKNSLLLNQHNGDDAPQNQKPQCFSSVLVAQSAGRCPNLYKAPRIWYQVVLRFSVRKDVAFCVCVKWAVTVAIRYIIHTRFKHRIKLLISFNCTNNIRLNVKFGA